jgi:hypothetical protein
MSRRAPLKAESAAQPPEAGLGVGQLMGRARASLLSSLDTELGSFGLNSTQYAVLKHRGEGARAP